MKLGRNAPCPCGSGKKYFDFISIYQPFFTVWGVITTDPKQGFNREAIPQKVEIQPLLTQTFQFTV